MCDHHGKTQLETPQVNREEIHYQLGYIPAAEQSAHSLQRSPWTHHEQLSLLHSCPEYGVAGHDWQFEQVNLNDSHAWERSVRSRTRATQTNKAAVAPGIIHTHTHTHTVIVPCEKTDSQWHSNTILSTATAYTHMELACLN